MLENYPHGMHEDWNIFYIFAENISSRRIYRKEISSRWIYRL